MNSSFEFDGFAPHLFDLMHLDAAAIEIGVEQAQTFGRTLHLFQRGGSRQQQDLVGDLRGRNPHLGAVDDIAVAFADGAGFELRRVEPGVRLGNREAGLLASFDHSRQHAPLLLFSAEHDDRIEAEDIDVYCRSARHAGAGFGDGPHHDRGLGDAETGTAILLGNTNAEPAFRGECRVEIVRKAALAISFEPVRIVEAAADGQDRIADRLLFGAESEIHQTRSEFAGAAAAACGPWTTPFVNKSSIDCSASPNS